MEPRIQYAKTSDGVSIAYWTAGNGPAFVQMPGMMYGPTGSVLAEGGARRWTERLAERRLVVRYSPRGFGQSDHDVGELSAEGWLLDLEAVVDHLHIEPVALFAALHAGPIAIAYAVRHPERVSHLVLYSTSARGASLFFFGGARQQALEQLAETDWETYTEVVAHTSVGWERDELARRLAAYLRENATRESLQAVNLAVRAADVTALLPRVSSPTIVIYRRRVGVPAHDEQRLLASRIPNAQLVPLEGDRLMPYEGDMMSVLLPIEEFLGDTPSQPGETVASLRTILFTDLASSTSLTQRLGDTKAQELVRAHNAIIRKALAQHGGTEIKHTGDGIMASFPTASGALECAVAIQRAVSEHENTDLAVHVGVNAGEPVAEESDLFGTAVQLARRICDAAEGGEILVSNVVRELAAGKGFLFSDRGETALRGFEDPVRLYELRWRPTE